MNYKHAFEDDPMDFSTNKAFMQSDPEEDYEGRRSEGGEEDDEDDVTFDDEGQDEIECTEERKKELLENEEVRGVLSEFFDAHIGETFTTERLFEEISCKSIENIAELKMLLDDLAEQRLIDIEIIDPTADPEYGKKE